MTKKPGEFSKKVIELALTIPAGRVTTYGLITAAAGGHPMLSRMITHILVAKFGVTQNMINGEPNFTKKRELKLIKIIKSLILKK
jgi:hypothetical protein